MQSAQEIANDWVRFAEKYWWEPVWFEDKDKIRLSEHIRQVLNNLDQANENHDTNAAFREIERIRKKGISINPFESGVALRRCGQVALQMGYIAVAAEMLRLSQFDIGRDKKHYFAVINWMEGCVAWIMPRNRHNVGINCWQACIDSFKELSESSDVAVAYLNWYKKQRRIMIEALEFAIENDRLPPVWLILEMFGIEDPDFTPSAEKKTTPPPPPPASKKVENYFDLFVVYEDIPAGMPAPSGYVPTAGHPVHPGLEPDDHIEVTRVRVGGQEYSLHSIGLRGRKINLTQGAEHFVLRVRGNSMNQAGIEHGNLVLCRAQRTARHEDIAAIAFDLNNLDLDDENLAPLKKLRMTLGPDGELPTTLKRFVEQEKDISIRAESDDPAFDGFDVTIPKSRLASEEHIIIYGVAVAVLKPV